MKSFKVLIGLIFLSFSLIATAAEGKWIKGYGQGKLEYFVDKGDARLYIGCPSQESNDGGNSRIMFFVKNVEVTSFKLEVGGYTIDGPLETGSRVGDNSFIFAIDKLLESDAKVKYGKNVVVFPKANINKVLHSFMSGKLGCAIN